MATKSDKKKLVLLDSHAIIHRAYHALPDFATASGEPTGALYGLATMLISIIDELNPEYIVACFDLPEPTHRHEVYEAYKAGRKATEDNLALQLERAKDLFTAWGIPMYSHSGFEADDMLGTIVEQLKKNKDVEIIIASGDMDTMQLVDGKKVQVYTLKKGIRDTILYDEKAVEDRFGFKPKLLPDFKGLRGDPSDNIIGVKGIGEKTATALIQTFGTIEKMYSALKKDPESYKKAGITERIKNLLLENEEEALFSKTLATIRPDAPIEFELPNPWKQCLEIEKLSELFRVLEFRTMTERVKMVLNKKEGDKKVPPAKAPSTKRERGGSKGLSEDERLLTLALWVIDSNLTSPTMDDVYAFTKTNTPEEARVAIEKELDARNVRSVFEILEKPLLPIVDAMNECGVKIDAPALKKLSEAYHTELSRLEKEIWEMGGGEFNINSPKQMGEILFEKLNLGEKRQKKTSTGNFSTKESELEKLKDKHPIIEKILEYRELQKLLSVYIDVIPTMLDANARLHSTFEQAGTTTGRMASTNPNLQNIPVKTELGRAIRGAFIAEEGYSLVSLDYSQIELRIAAILSTDEKLLDIFRRGEDVHTGVAMRVFGVKAEDVDKGMRTKAKTINFGILYGMGVNALKTNLRTDRKDAQEFYNNYFETFSQLARYLEEVKASALEKGYTETMFGRRRYFSGFKSPLPWIRAQAERMAINAPIQGTQADLTKIAMIGIDAFLKEKNLSKEARLILQVHDEVVYEIQDEKIAELVPVFKKIMEDALPKDKTLGIPIIAEAHVGKNWDRMQKL